VTAADGGRIYCDALLVTQEFLICGARVSEPTVLVANGGRWPLTTVRTATIGEGTDVTLLRLPPDLPLIPLTLSSVDTSQRLHASAAGNSWEGTVKRVTEDQFCDVEPDFSLPGGLPVFRADDPSALIGLSVAAKTGVRITTIRNLLHQFPELQGVQ
jgi:hypothetical protein